MSESPPDLFATDSEFNQLNEAEIDEVPDGCIDLIKIG
jgi:hypothetical protein